eukprot:6418135-Prymnesium_polylepis.1
MASIDAPPPTRDEVRSRLLAGASPTAGVARLAVRAASLRRCGAASSSSSSLPSAIGRTRLPAPPPALSASPLAPPSSRMRSAPAIHAPCSAKPSGCASQKSSSAR